MNETEFRDPGELPVIDWVDKNLIDVDATYQRGLDEARVQRITDWFSWDSFGAIVVAPIDGGRYHVIDGQHRYEAAKRHPLVTLLPAVIIVGRGVVAEAETFVNVNGARKNVSPLEMYWASLAAGDPDAATIKQVAERAGVTIRRYPGSNGSYAPGETVAIGAIRSLVDGKGAMRARQILEALVSAALAPITANQIKAADLLLTDPEFADQIDGESIADAIRGSAGLIEDEANAFASTHRLPKAKAFASVWFRKCKKRRRPAAAGDTNVVPMTRGEAHRMAEAREAEDMAKAEDRALVRDQQRAAEISSIVTVFNATVMEAKLIKELMTGRILTKEAIHQLLYAADAGGGPDLKVIDVMVCKIRPKLEDHSIEIMTIRGMGYKMAPEMVRRTEAVMRRAS